MGRLDLRICEARNLKNPDFFGLPDPYVTVELEGTKHQTSSKSDTLNPKWDEVFKFNVADEHSAQLRFTIWNKELGDDDFMGEYYLSIAGLVRGQIYDQWLLLRNTQAGELRVRVMAIDFGVDAAPPNAPYYPVPPQTWVPPPQFVAPPPPPTFMPPTYQPQIFYPPQPISYPAGVQPPPMDQPTNFHKPTNTHTKWSQPEHGALFHEDGTGRILVLMDETLRHIPNEHVFHALFNKPLDPSQLNRFPAGSVPHPEGAPLPHNARLVRPDGEPEIYLIDQENGREVRRWVSNAGIFENLNFAWSKVKVENPEAVMTLPEGSAIPKTPTDGCLFYDNDTGAVYLFLDGGLRHIQNEQQYYRLFEIPLSPDNFKRFSGPLVYPIIHPVPLEAGLVRPDGDPHVFLIDLQRGRLVKRHIKNEAVFYQHNFHFNDVHVQPLEWFDHYPAGTPIGPETEMPEERLFYNQKTGAVSLLIDHEIRQIPNPEVFNHLFSVPLVPDSFRQYRLYSGFAEGLPFSTNSKFIKGHGDAAVYLIDNVNGREVRRHIKSEAVMNRNKFNWNAIHEVDPAYVLQFPQAAPLL